MSKRTGATLVEVLVAIFVMGIGLLAMLALFPLGVLSMAQAIQDDRAAHAAANASAMAVAQNMHNDRNLIDRVVNNVVVPGPFTNPAPNDLNVTVQNAPDNGQSWPVLVDGVGRATAPAPYFNWVGGVKYGIARRTVSYAPTTNPQAVLQWFTLLDDIRFDVNGTPAQLAPGSFDREGNFSWAYLMRRPRNAYAGAVSMDVVVYSRRSLNLSSQLAPPEYAYDQTVYDPTRPNIITVKWTSGQNPPPVRAGSWILDATPVAIPPGPGQTKPTVKPGHAQFYRIVGVNELAPDAVTNLNQIELELQDNVQGFPTEAQTTTSPPYTATFVVLDGVVQVFPRGTQWRP